MPESLTLEDLAMPGIRIVALTRNPSLLTVSLDNSFDNPGGGCL